MNKYSRRNVLKKIGLGTAALYGLPACLDMKEDQKRHYITLSFDDGFRESSLKTAEIYEKYNLSACINVIATAHQPGFELPNVYHAWPAGDFDLWNELQDRGHEIMMHGYKHANMQEIPFSEAKDLILRCIDVFSSKLKGFDPQESVFNFPHNASTTELEEWLAPRVRAFRTGGSPVNPLPHKDQVRLTCISSGPRNIDRHLEAEIEKLLSLPSGWLIYNTHGLDDEGWGPISSDFLDSLLGKLVKMSSVEIIPAGKALARV